MSPSLAAATAGELLRAWGGLGYPRRALALRDGGPGAGGSPRRPRASRRGGPGGAAGCRPVYRAGRGLDGVRRPRDRPRRQCPPCPRPRAGAAASRERAVSGRASRPWPMPSRPPTVPRTGTTPSWTSAPPSAGPSPTAPPARWPRCAPGPPVTARPSRRPLGRPPPAASRSGTPIDTSAAGCWRASGTRLAAAWRPIDPEALSIAPDRVATGAARAPAGGPHRGRCGRQGAPADDLRPVPRDARFVREPSPSSGHVIHASGADWQRGSPRPTLGSRSARRPGDVPRRVPEAPASSAPRRPRSPSRASRAVPGHKSTAASWAWSCS